MNIESFLNEIYKYFNNHITDDKIGEYKTHHKKIKIQLKYIDYSRFCFHEQEKQNFY